MAHPVPSFQERKADLLQLKKYLREHRPGIVAAIGADYGHRSSHETLLIELLPVAGE
ncbi:MAG: coniferyl-aldehyde dehydrogenase, partial [Betaproteobacteria bacterium]|nr:coniferyl-aldehyde dehydrogenase [Betaproteobacteria bacterium]